jgi:hypothetical protein
MQSRKHCTVKYTFEWYPSNAKNLCIHHYFNSHKIKSQSNQSNRSENFPYLETFEISISRISSIGPKLWAIFSSLEVDFVVTRILRHWLSIRRFSGEPQIFDRYDIDNIYCYTRSEPPRFPRLFIIRSSTLKKVSIAFLSRHGRFLASDWHGSVSAK